jgi:hypothetical protein
MITETEFMSAGKELLLWSEGVGEVVGRVVFEGMVGV